MKPLSHACRLPRPTVGPLRLRQRARRAFSLVEVTLALGLVTFVLVAVIGTVPVALNSGRQSFDQNRASAVADSLFASFRSQPFDNVCYLDSQFQADGVTTAPNTGFNLNTLNTAVPAPAPSDAPTTPKAFYASFLDANDTTSSGDAFGEQRKLTFTPYSVGTQPPPGASYLVTLYFNNRPDGMTISPSASGLDGDSPSGSTTPAQANQIEMVISPVGQPSSKYHFVSTLANRL